MKSKASMHYVHQDFLMNITSKSIMKNECIKITHEPSFF